MRGIHCESDPCSEGMWWLCCAGGHRVAMVCSTVNQHKVVLGVNLYPAMRRLYPDWSGLFLDNSAPIHTAGGAHSVVWRARNDVSHMRRPFCRYQRMCSHHSIWIPSVWIPGLINSHEQHDPQFKNTCRDLQKPPAITAEIPHPMNVTACITLCGGGARGTACSHCGSKHKLKVLCLAFCVSCHKKKNVAASPPNPRSCCCFVCIFFWRATRWIRAEQPACFDRISQNKSEVVQVRIMGLE